MQIWNKIEAFWMRPSRPCPIPAEGGPVYSGEDDGPVPVIRLAKSRRRRPCSRRAPAEPRRRRPRFPGNVIQPLPVQPLPTITYAAVRFLNAAYGYPRLPRLCGRPSGGRPAEFRVELIGLHAPDRQATQTVTVTGTDGYIYIQEELSRLNPAAASPSPSSISPGGLGCSCCASRIPPAFCPVAGGNASSASATSPETAARSTFPCRMARRGLFRCALQGDHLGSSASLTGASRPLFAETDRLPAPAYTDIETFDSAYIGANPLSRYRRVGLSASDARPRPTRSICCKAGRATTPSARWSCMEDAMSKTNTSRLF